MSDRHVLVMGNYPDFDEAGLESAFTLHRTHPDRMEPDEAALIRALAFKWPGPMNGALMDKLPNLELIANFGVGYDAIDVAAASERGIKVTNTPDVLTDDVADLAVAMLLGITRQIVQADAWVRSGDWAAKGDYPLLRKASGKRAGIVGLAGSGGPSPTGWPPSTCRSAILPGRKRTPPRAGPTTPTRRRWRQRSTTSSSRWLVAPTPPGWSAAR